MRHGRASAVGLALMAVLGAFGMPSERTQVVQMLGLRPYNLTADLVDKDSADIAGDLFFLLGDRITNPLRCPQEPESPLCGCEVTCEDNVYTLYDVEVRGGFGGYAMCNPDANATYHCEQGSTRLVGLAQVETRYQEPEGPYNYDLWKFQASKLVGGLWYSTPKAGLCGENVSMVDSSSPEGFNSSATCTWRIKQEVRTVNASCANAAVERFVQAQNVTCFDGCAQPYNTTSECWIECFFDTALQMTREQLLAPFTTAITSDDVSAGGCPTRAPYVPPDDDTSQGDAQAAPSVIMQSI